MRNRIQRLLNGSSGQIVLLAAVGLLGVACCHAGTDPEGQSDLPKFPPAPPENGGPVLCGSQGLDREEFLQCVVNDASAKWQVTFGSVQREYSPVAFHPYDQSVAACGVTRDQGSGPMYCGRDQTIYFPINWVDPNTDRPMAEYGDFAMAYVAAHEVGHHVQEQLGIREGGRTERETELEADCLAGVWGYSAYYEDFVKSGDIAKVEDLSWNSGDLPEQPRGGPGAHGRPEERVTAFRKGYDYGDVNRCLSDPA